jgi:hypothetical protein
MYQKFVAFKQTEPFDPTYLFRVLVRLWFTSLATQSHHFIFHYNLNVKIPVRFPQLQRQRWLL